MSKYTQVFCVVLCFFVSSLAQALPIDQVKSSVVHVKAATSIKEFAENLPSNIDEVPGGASLEELLRNFLDDDGPAGNKEVFSQGGSGIVVPTGHVLTTYQLVKGAKTVTVVAANKQELTAEVVGFDERRNVALLKLPQNDAVKSIEWAKKNDPELGTPVMAVTSPLPFEYAVHVGIISLKLLPANSPFETSTLELQLPLRPGSAGGGVFDMEGKFLGMLLPLRRSEVGFSHAIPSQVLETMVAELLTHGRLARGWLGVSFQAVTKELAKSFNLKSLNGALVTRIFESSPAIQGGLQEGDVILSIDGVVLNNPEELSAIMAQKTPGKTVTLDVSRQGQSKKLRVVVGEMPKDTLSQALLEEPKKDDAKLQNPLGVAVRDLTKEERKVLNMTQGGVRVTDVEESRVGQSIGLLSGDVILAINRVPVDSKQHFDYLLQVIPRGQFVPLLVRRNGQPQYYLVFKID